MGDLGQTGKHLSTQVGSKFKHLARRVKDKATVKDKVTGDHETEMKKQKSTKRLSLEKRKSWHLFKSKSISDTENSHVGGEEDWEVESGIKRRLSAEMRKSRTLTPKKEEAEEKLGGAKTEKEALAGEDVMEKRREGNLSQADVVVVDSKPAGEEEEVVNTHAVARGISFEEKDAISEATGNDEVDVVVSNAHDDGSVVVVDDVKETSLVAENTTTDEAHNDSVVDNELEHIETNENTNPEAEHKETQKKLKKEEKTEENIKSTPKPRHGGNKKEGTTEENQKHEGKKEETKERNWHGGHKKEGTTEENQKHERKKEETKEDNLHGKRSHLKHSASTDLERRKKKKNSLPATNLTRASQSVLGKKSSLPATNLTRASKSSLPATNFKRASKSFLEHDGKNKKKEKTGKDKHREREKTEKDKHKEREKMEKDKRKKGLSHVFPSSPFSKHKKEHEKQIKGVNVERKGSDVVVEKVTVEPDGTNVLKQKVGRKSDEENVEEHLKDDIPSTTHSQRGQASLMRRRKQHGDPCVIKEEDDLSNKPIHIRKSLTPAVYLSLVWPYHASSRCVTVILLVIFAVFWGQLISSPYPWSVYLVFVPVVTLFNFLARWVFLDVVRFLH